MEELTPASNMAVFWYPSSISGAFSTERNQKKTHAFRIQETKRKPWPKTGDTEIHASKGIPKWQGFLEIQEKNKLAWKRVGWKGLEGWKKLGGFFGVWKFFFFWTLKNILKVLRIFSGGGRWISNIISAQVLVSFICCKAAIVGFLPMRWESSLRNTSFWSSLSKWWLYEIIPIWLEFIWEI